MKTMLIESAIWLAAFLILPVAILSPLLIGMMQSITR